MPIVPANNCTHLPHTPFFGTLPHLYPIKVLVAVAAAAGRSSWPALVSAPHRFWPPFVAPVPQRPELVPRHCLDWRQWRQRLVPRRS